MSFGIKLKRNFHPDKVAKQLTFATASGLTATVKQAQGGVINALPQTFTIRGNWFQPNNRFGIKIKSATKTNLVAEVGTNADWLQKFETGEDKTPTRNFLAIPTDKVRRTKRMIIQKAQRPVGLRGRNDIVLQTKSGPVLFQRQGRGKNKKLVALYNLETRAKIQKNSAVIVPALRVIRQRLNKNITNSFVNALKTAR